MTDGGRPGLVDDALALSERTLALLRGGGVAALVALLVLLVPALILFMGGTWVIVVVSVTRFDRSAPPSAELFLFRDLTVAVVGALLLSTIGALVQAGPLAAFAAARAGRAEIAAAIRRGFARSPHLALVYAATLGAPYFLAGLAAGVGRYAGFGRRFELCFLAMFVALLALQVFIATFAQARLFTHAEGPLAAARGALAVGKSRRRLAVAATFLPWLVPFLASPSVLAKDTLPRQALVVLSVVLPIAAAVVVLVLRAAIAVAAQDVCLGRSDADRAP